MELNQDENTLTIDFGDTMQLKPRLNIENNKVTEKPRAQVSPSAG